MTGIVTTLPPLIEKPPGNNASNPAGLSGVTYTFALLGLGQTWTATQTFPLGMIVLNAADVAGSFSASQMPAFTGDVTTVGGSIVTTIAANAVTNAKSAQMAAYTIKGNATGGTANATDIAFSSLLSSTSFTYTQVETGAAASPLIRRLNNALYASEFGAVGDNSTNDYTALQAFLTAVGTTGKEGHLDPGKTYYVSGGDLTLSPAAGVENTILYGHGSQIRTDPTQARTGLVIQAAAAVTRADQTRKTIVEGLRIVQFQDGNALWGFRVSGTTFVTLKNCVVVCGSDNATNPSAAYAAYYFTQSDINNPNTGCFWCTMDNCTVQGATTYTPVGIRLDGQCNAFRIINCTISLATEGVYLTRCNTASSSATAGLANGVRITNCDFEGGTDGIVGLGVTGYSTLPGLIVSGCRAESLTNFFNYGTGITINPSDSSYPIIGPNYLASTVATAIANPNSLPIRQIPVGTPTNDNTTLGSVGEYVSSSVASGSAVSLTTGTAKDVTTISLTAGDWDVWGNVAFGPAGTTTQSGNIAWISTTANTLPTIPNGGAYAQFSVAVAAGLTVVLNAGQTRLSLSGTTTVSLGALSNFAVSTNTAYGFIGARRRR